MANFSLYYPTLLKHEGGFVNDPNDKGGATNLGVTLAVWIKNGYDKDGDGDVDVEDLKDITLADAEQIAKRLYWDKVKGDDIDSQSVAEFVFDWAYNSGVGTASKKLQLAVGAEQDGVIGPATIDKINTDNAFALFNRLKVLRLTFVFNIVTANPSQKKFLKGWVNRINSFKFKK